MQRHTDDAAETLPDQSHEPKVTFQSSCMTIKQLRPPKKLDVQQFRQYVDEHGIMRPVAGDEAVFAFVARGQQSGRVLDQRDANHPRVLLLGDPKVPVGLSSALAQLGLGEKADVFISAKLMRTTADADGRAHVVRIPQEKADADATPASDARHSTGDAARQGRSEPPSKQPHSSQGMQHANSLLDELIAEVHANEDVVYEGLDLLAIVPGHGKKAAKPIMANAPRDEAGTSKGLTYHQVKKHAASHAADGTNPDLLPHKRKGWFRRHVTIDFKAPWKAVKTVGTILGVRDLAIGRRSQGKHQKRQQQEQQQQQQEEDENESKPGSMAVLAAH